MFTTARADTALLTLTVRLVVHLIWVLSGSGSWPTASQATPDAAANTTTDTRSVLVHGHVVEFALQTLILVDHTVGGDTSLT